ncbi:MAG: DUF421 domain-containing protein [Chloroflexota bacterium]
MESLLSIAIRATFAYVYALGLLRLTGKRDIGALSAIDLVVTLIVSDMFDDIIWGDVALSQGAVGLSTVMLLHVLVSYFAYRSRTLDRVFVGTRAILVTNGVFVQSGMRRERMRQTEVWSQLRLHGRDALDDVKEAGLESSGQTSLLPHEWAKPAVRGDLPRLRELRR